MPKKLQKVTGWLLTIWGAIRTPVDFLDSVKATRHYAEYLYSHWHLALVLVPGSFWLTLGLWILGLGIIFSDRVSDVVNKWWPRRPNIKCQQILNCAILWDETNGCYVRKADPPRSAFGILLEIANQVEHGKPSPTAGRIKAQIIFHFKNNHELRAAPIAWIDEPTSSVELGPGDTRCLIVARAYHFTEDWGVPLNRRSDTSSPRSFEHYEIPSLIGDEGKLEVQVISTQTNNILVTFVFGWQWKFQYPLELTRLIEMKV